MRSGGGAAAAAPCGITRSVRRFATLWQTCALRSHTPMEDPLDLQVPCSTLCPSAAPAASKPASMRGHCKYAIQLFTGVRLPHPEKIISILGRSNLVWVSEWISLRVKTSTSVLSYVSTNGRGKRCVLFQLLGGTTVSPPKAIFASGLSS